MSVLNQLTREVISRTPSLHTRRVISQLEMLQVRDGVQLEKYVKKDLSRGIIEHFIETTPNPFRQLPVDIQTGGQGIELELYIHTPEKFREIIEYAVQLGRENPGREFNVEQEINSLQDGRL